MKNIQHDIQIQVRPLLQVISHLGHFVVGGPAGQHAEIELLNELLAVCHFSQTSGQVTTGGQHPLDLTSVGKEQGLVDGREEVALRLSGTGTKQRDKIRDVALEFVVDGLLDLFLSCCHLGGVLQLRGFQWRLLIKFGDNSPSRAVDHAGRFQHAPSQLLGGQWSDGPDGKLLGPGLREGLDGLFQRAVIRTGPGPCRGGDSRQRVPPLADFRESLCRLIHGSPGLGGAIGCSRSSRLLAGKPLSGRGQFLVETRGTALQGPGDASQLLVLTQFRQRGSRLGSCGRQGPGHIGQGLQLPLGRRQGLRCLLLLGVGRSQFFFPGGQLG